VQKGATLRCKWAFFSAQMSYEKAQMGRAGNENKPTGITCFARNNKFNKHIHISIIIMLHVSFCSDIWYCNILAYYLDKTTLLYKYQYFSQIISIL
jgi:hypothetical protein